MSMYPNNQVLEIFGEQIQWPGLGPDGKFTNGSFENPMVKPSFVPAETLNLLIDNIQSVLGAAGLEANNVETDQLLRTLRGGIIISNNFAPRTVGEYHFLSCALTVEEMVQKWYLPLQYQLIRVDSYQELCEKNGLARLITTHGSKNRLPAHLQTKYPRRTGSLTRRQGTTGKATGGTSAMLPATARQTACSFG